MPRMPIAEVNRRKADTRLLSAARRALNAVRPILAKLPCRTETTQNSRAFLPTSEEMAEARGALMELDAALEPK